MSDITPNFGLPYILPSQAQKHVTHNEALRMLDGIVQISVADRDIAVPPAQPAEGNRYLVPAAASGAWTDKAGTIAAWQDAAWTHFTPRAGWLAWIADEARLMVFDGNGWIDAPSPSQTPLLGINAPADPTSRLVVASAATLFTHAGAGHQHKINKSAAGDTASLLFQTSWSGRAEMGTMGDDKWRLKVSSDGIVWREAIIVDQTTGKVTFPSGGIRETLTANRTYYVRTDGNDGSTGLSNTAAGAFRTIQRAVDTAASLDTSIYDVTVQIGAGSHGIGSGLVARQCVGAGSVIIIGSEAAPSTVILNTTGNGTTYTLLSRNCATTYKLRGVKISSSGASTNFGLAATSARIEVARFV